MTIASRFFGRLVVTILCCHVHISAAQTVTPLFQHGPTARRINVVVVSEGFQQNELEQFREEAGDFVDHIFSEDPFLRYKSYFNAYTLSIPSNESGADEPSKNIEVDTAFDATYDSFGIEQLLTVSTRKVGDALTLHFPEHDIVLVLVNSDRHGGSGGIYAVSSTNSSAYEIAAHEIGHSFAGLTDEYETPDGTPTEAPNATQETNRSSIKWINWIEESTPIPTAEKSSYKDKIGLFEGAAYRSSDWFRPHLDSKMRTLGRNWGDVNAETIILSIYNRLPLFSGTSPDQGRIRINTAGVVGFEALSPLPQTNDKLQYQWYIDGRQLPTSEPTLNLNPLNLENGLHTLELRAHDQTNLVRTDKNDLLSQSASWQLDINHPENATLPYSDWAVFWINQPENRSILHDIDLDGLTNIEEFYLGLNPEKSNHISNAYSYGFEEGRLYLRITRLASSHLATVYVEGSTELGNWQTIAESINSQPFTSLGNAKITESAVGDSIVTTVWDNKAVSSETSNRHLRIRIRTTPDHQP